MDRRRSNRKKPDRHFENIKPSGAQAAVNVSKGTIIDITLLKATKHGDINMRKPDSKSECWTMSILAISNKIIVADYNNAVLKLFNEEGQCLSSFNVQSIGLVRGIAQVNDETFVTCGLFNKIHTFKLLGDSLIKQKDSIEVDYYAYGISYSGKYYCLLNVDDNAITILDRQGKLVKKILVKEAFRRKVSFDWDIHMDTKTHNIYLLCQDDHEGLLCISKRGEPLWFTPITGWFVGITEIYGLLAVADGTNQCIHLVSKTGQYQRVLLNSRDLVGDPFSVFFDRKENKLYVGYNCKNTISFYSVETL